MKRYLKSMWRIEKPKKVRLSQTKKNRANRASYKKIKNMTPEEREAHDQLVLWFNLRKIFNRKEYIHYEDLPDTLREQIEPFEEFVYPIRPYQNVFSSTSSATADHA